MNLISLREQTKLLSSSQDSAHREGHGGQSGFASIVSSRMPFGAYHLRTGSTRPNSQFRAPRKIEVVFTLNVN